MTRVRPLSRDTGDLLVIKRIKVRSRGTLFIGDNLDVLRDLKSGSVDLIYLHPPGNTGKLQEGEREAAGVSYADIWTAADMRADWLAEIETRSSGALALLNSARVVHGESMAGYLTFMAVRLVELQRVMKRTGSIYLHCRPRTSHWLRVMMDAVFGQENFTNEISFQRTAVFDGGHKWKAAHDTLLFYTGTQKHRWTWLNEAFHPQGYYARNYRYIDHTLGLRFQTASLTRKGVRKDDRGAPWHNYNPTADGKYWMIPNKWVDRVLGGARDKSIFTAQEKLDVLHGAGMIYQPASNREPYYKIHMGSEDGPPISDFVSDIGRIEAGDVQRTGWPGQVPIALLERIIRASSRPGDVVLDPFCGSGTTCVAAQRLGREWVGVEKVDRVLEVLRRRLNRETQIRPAGQARTIDK